MTGPARRPVDDALDRLQSKVRSYIYGTWGDAGDDRARPAIAALDELLSTVREALERQRQERDAAWRKAESERSLVDEWTAHAATEREGREAAEAEVRRLTEGLREIWDIPPGEHLNRARDKARALLDASPTDGEAIVVDETGVLPSGRHISVFDAEDEDEGGAKFCDECHNPIGCAKYGRRCDGGGAK